MTACSAVVLCVDDVSLSSPCEQLTIDRSINTVITKAIEQVVLEDLQKIVQILGLADEKDMFSAILLYIEANPEIFKMIFSQNTTAHMACYGRIINIKQHTDSVLFSLKISDKCLPISFSPNSFTLISLFSSSSIILIWSDKRSMQTDRIFISKSMRSRGRSKTSVPPFSLYY